MNGLLYHKLIFLLFFFGKLLKYKDVIITPHALCWTDECFNDIATEAIESILNYIDKKPILNQVNK